MRKEDVEMKKKIVIGCIGIIFMLAMISMVSAISTQKIIQKKESPLFTIRTNNAVQKNMANLKTRFVGKKIFFLPIIPNNECMSLRDKFSKETSGSQHTCGTSNTCIYHNTCSHTCGKVTFFCCKLNIHND